MNIYFCDECGSRVSGLDLRAGKGMRRRYDVICLGCIEQGHAERWLARTNEVAKPEQQMAAAANGTARPSAAVAIVEPPNLIDVGRDRAQTEPDDPFTMDEPEPLKPATLPKADGLKRRQSETDAIAAPASKPSHDALDGLAAAGGSFGALARAGGASRQRNDLVNDDPIDGSGVDVRLPTPDSPFAKGADRGTAPSPGSSETEEVIVPNSSSEKRPSDADKPRSSSGRQSAQKRGSTSTSRRPTAKSSRRSTNPLQSKKMLIFSLVGCVVMVLIFAALPPSGSGKKGGGVERYEPLNNLQLYIDEAGKLGADAMNNRTDYNKQVTALRAIDGIQAKWDEFEREAKKSKDKDKWNDETLTQQYENMRIKDVKTLRKAIYEFKVILEQQGKH